MSEVAAEERVVVLAPVGQDAAVMGALLEANHFSVEICQDAVAACRVLSSRAGSLLLTEEALEDPAFSCLLELLKTQPPWSEIPLIILTSGGESRLAALLDATAAAAGSVTVLERPMATATLLRSMQVALRSRRRQYQVRDLLQSLQESMELAVVARREAEAADLAKDDFIAALSHELRTPLSPVLMTAADLESDPALPAETRAQLTMIRRNVELEARLIDDLLDLTRIRRGIMQIDPVPGDVHELLLRAEEIVRHDSAGKCIGLRLDLAAPRHYVRGDPARLQQVFWNLLKNAIKFTPRGGNIFVHSSNPDPEHISITVRDTGIGITEGSLQRIFLAFDQGELPGRHRFGGLGLGLSISKAIIERHGGTLTAASEGTDKGSTFTVELAVIPSEALPGRNSTPPDNNSRPAALRLLYVEDHLATLNTVVAFLKRDGHQVFPATTIQDALTLAATHECDLLISDLGLPDGSGLILMREIKARYGIPGIALSGFGMSTDLQDSKEAGFVIHLVKPVSISALRQAIQKLGEGLARKGE